MPKIDEMFAFVVQDTGPDDEGIMAELLPNGSWAPMVGADMTRVRSIIPRADAIAKITGKSYKILHFKLVGEIPPSRPGRN